MAKKRDPVDDVLDAIVWMRRKSKQHEAVDDFINALLTMRRKTRKKAGKKTGKPAKGAARGPAESKTARKPQPSKGAGAVNGAKAPQLRRKERMASAAGSGRPNGR